MTKASLTTKAGTIITIEGTTEEVAKIIRLTESVDEIRGSSPAKKSSSVKNQKPKKQSFNATDTILELKEGGYFNKPRTLSDVKRALEEQGQIFPLTTLSGLMLKQVRKRTIRRIKQNKNWAYVKGSN